MTADPAAAPRNPSPAEETGTGTAGVGVSRRGRRARFFNPQVRRQVRLRREQGLTVAEIAAEIGCSTPT